MTAVYSQQPFGLCYNVWKRVLAFEDVAVLVQQLFLEDVDSITRMLDECMLVTIGP